MTGAGRPRVVVVGLGPAGPDLLPPAAVSAMVAAARCLLRTERHPAAGPAAQAVVAAGGSVAFLDALYEGADDFDRVYAAIVERVADEARAVHEAAADGRSDGGPGSAGGAPQGGAAAPGGPQASAAAPGGPQAAAAAPYVCYAVPGSPLVAERTVDLLRGRDDVQVEVVPAVSFLDLAWARLQVDPVASGVRLVDAAAFAVDAAGQPGPFLVAQCHNRALLSEVKLALGDRADRAGVEPPPAVLLHHLGLADEQVLHVAWADLDRTIEPDHLTALWVPAWGRSVASESARLEELVRVLRERCPWDRRQTHASLAPHLVEEAYEAVDAILALAGVEDAGPVVPGAGAAVPGAGAAVPGAGAAVPAPEAVAGDALEADLLPAAAEHLMEELGDVAFQVYFHAQLAAESGWFTVGDVLRAVHDKLVHRHPHVFGDAVAETAEDVAQRWEVLKQREKGRASVFDGIPSALPALASAAKVQRRAESVGAAPVPAGSDAAGLLAGLVAAAATAGEGAGSAGEGAGSAGEGAGSAGEGAGSAGEGAGSAGALTGLVGRTLFAVVDLARRCGVDPEIALRTVTTEFRRQAERDR